MRHTASVAAICRAVLEAVLYATTDCICIVDECNLCTTKLKARIAYKYRGPTARGCTCGYYFELRAVLLTVSAEPLLLWQIPHENPSPPLTSSHWTYTLPLAPSSSTTPAKPSHSNTTMAVWDTARVKVRHRLHVACTIPLTS